MIYYLLTPYADQFLAFNLFRYITFRSGMALLTSLSICMILMPYFIKYLKYGCKIGQPIREFGPETHLVKAGTPTMGGLIILFAVIISVLLWSNLENIYVWVVLFVSISFGILGFVDDYVKVTKKYHHGISGKSKLIVQIIVSILSFYLIYKTMDPEFKTSLSVPFFKNLLIDFGLFYFVFVVIVVVGSSNAVNLTDGLDGLAIVPIIVAIACFGLISYLVGNSIFAHYLQLHYIEGASEITIFCASLVGAGLGFLWYNAPPAEIFMGDTGSLACGGAIGIISVITKHELVLSIIGGLFVMEAISVIIQVYYFRFTGGKRFFKMAPFHHHFEKCGWSESKVVIRFWIIAVIFAIIGLSTLKLR